MKLLLLSLIAASVNADSGNNSPNQNTPDLSSMSIEQLMDINATSILKGPGKPSHSPVAIYVITEEDIRRSGMTSIPELLRMVPGMSVARGDATNWSISARGMSELGADKMLVLIDGRRVYDPLIAGVFWDAQDLPLYDIAQIEVIRGPGSSLWGADAVNGVVNIITKRARETQGSLTQTGGGNLDGAAGSAQFGGRLGQRTYFRIFGKYNRENLFRPDATPSETPPISTSRGGFRLDSDVNEKNFVTVEGGIYSGSIGNLDPALRLTTPRDGADLLSRWTHRLAGGSEATLQVYWDYTNRSVYASEFVRHTVDIDFEHELTVAEKHNIVWGLRADYSRDRSTDSAISGWTPPSIGYKVFDGFLQDEFPIAGDFRLTVGSKFEHNDYTGFEWQPNVRLAWTPNDRQTAWGAVSRGVVVPSFDNWAGYIYLPPTLLQPGMPRVALSFRGTPGLASENLLAYEAGYRTTIHRGLSIDVAAFYNSYSHLVSDEQAPPSFGFDPQPYLIEQVTPANKMKGETHGLELSAMWKPLDKWKIIGSYSWLDMHLHLLPGSSDITSLLQQGQSPQHQVQVHSYLDVRRGFELDAALHYASALPAWNIAPYTRCDLRAGWRPGQHAEFSLTGQNLLSGRHLEMISAAEIPSTSIHRSIYGQVLWRF